MKYSSLIDRAFASLKFKPINGQKDIINDVLVEFIDNGTKNVILSAPTGIGKSFIGVIISECFRLKHGENFNSIFLMQNNALVDQYSKNFLPLGEHKFFYIKGADNYACAALNNMAIAQNMSASDDTEFKQAIKKINRDSMTTHTAGECIKTVLGDGHEDCFGCKYIESKNIAQRTQNLISNFSMYFVSKLLSNNKTFDRNLVVFDEAHTLNDAFCNHSAVEISVTQLNEIKKRLQDETTDIKSIKYLGILDSINTMIRDLSLKKVNSQNYTAFLCDLRDLYMQIGSFYDTIINTSKDLLDSTKYQKVKGRYVRKSTTIKELLNSTNHTVFEFIDDELKLSVKPIFIKSVFSKLSGQYNLFMSGTITEELISKTCDLQHGVKFIKVKPVFDKEMRPVIFFNTQRLNYTTLRDYSTILKLGSIVKDIVDLHASNGESGIVLSPSLDLTEKISAVVKNNKNNKFQIFTQAKNEKSIVSIEKFKACKTPSVLISPSIFEGIDFPNDQSRFQILIKAPYPPLVDERVKYIFENFPDLYSTMTIMKIIQGFGRSVRNIDDWAITYILDENCKRLLMSPLNIWQDEYTLG